MAIQAQLYDGTTLEFPDGTDPSVVQATAKRITQERQAASAKPEEVGFFEAIPAAVKRGFESLGEVGTGLGLAAKRAVGDEEAVRKVMAEAKVQKPEEKPAMTVADFQRIAQEKGFAAAAAEAPKYIVEQVLQSAPQMAGPLAVGAGAAALSGPLAPIVGPIAGIATYGVQQFGNFLMRQAKEKNDPEELELTKAALTAAGTAPIGYFADRFAVGLSSVGKNAGEQAIKELAARRAAGELGAGAVGKEVAKRAGKGATVGIIAEAPTEVLEQVAERYQAGLDLNDEEAKNEYKEAFFGAAAAGGGIGGVSGAARGYAGYRSELGAIQPPAPPAPPAVTGEVPPETPPPTPPVRTEEERIRVVNGREESVAAQIAEIDDQISALSNQLQTIQNPNDPQISAINQELESLNLAKREVDRPAPLPEPGDRVVLNFETESGVRQKDAVVGQQYYVNAEGNRVERNQYGRLPKDATPVVPLTFDFEGEQITQTFSPTQLASQTAEIIKPATAPETVARGQMGFEFPAEEPGKEVKRTIEPEAVPEFELTSEGRVPEVEGIEELPEGDRARLMWVGTPGDPIKPLRNLFDSLKSASANPAESVKYRTEIRKFLDDVNEFVGGRMRKEVSRFREVDAEGRPIGPPPEPPKGPDVGVPLTGPELTRRMNFLNNFFDGLSIAPKEREALTSALSQQAAGMSAKQQAEVIGALTKLKNITSRQGIEKLREMFNSAIDKYERGRIGEAEAAVPFKGSEDVQSLDPYVAAAVGRALKSIDTRTPEGKAAMAYFGTETGWRYGLAMRSAAFDLAVPIDDFTGISFRGQNTKQAELFKEWVADNLPQQEYKKFEATVNQLREMNRRADQAMKDSEKRKRFGGIAPSFLSALYRKPTGKLENFEIKAAGLGKFMKPSEIKQLNARQWAMMHPAIQERIENNDINGALRLLADQKVDVRGETAAYRNFVAGLAKRLLELDLKTEIVVDQQNRLNADFIKKNARNQRTQFLQMLELFDWGKDFIAKNNLRGDLTDPNVIRQTHRVLEDIASGKISFGKDDVIGPISGQFTQLLKTYRDAVANLEAKGFFFSGANIINMNTERGGMSVATFLHEVVHAATLYNLMPANYDSLNKAQKDAVDELKKLYAYAKSKYEGTAAEGEYGFTSVEEFVSEALSNEGFQQFLQALKYEPTVTGTRAPTLWSKFVNLVSKLFGLNNVLGRTIENVNMIMRPSAKTDDSVVAYNSRGKSIMASTLPYNSSQYMGLLNTVLTGRLTWEGVKDRLRNVYVGALTLRQIGDIIGNKLPQVKAFITYAENMFEYRNAILEEVKAQVKPWQEYQTKNPEKGRTLSKLMIETTLKHKDPSKGKTGNKDIDDAWDSLGTDGQKIYNDVKAFYKRRYDAYVSTILDNKKMSLMADGYSEAEAVAHPDYLEIKKLFESKKIEPYFPLRRFGRFSVQFMHKDEREYYMFESPEQRDAFIKEYTPELQKRYGSRFDPEKDIKSRNSMRDLLSSEEFKNTQFLQTLKGLIKTTEGTTSQKLRDNLTEAVEELYLLQLPDDSIRKMFMNRKGTAGMDVDMLRAFTNSAFHMAYQHSRFKFSRQMYNAIDAASEMVGGMTGDEGKVLAEYVKEIRDHRIDYIMNPTDTGAIASGLSNMSFLWFMTSPASAITNMLGVPAVGLPVVGAKFGNAKTFATMMAYSKKVMGTGFKRENGELMSPSLSNRLDILSEAQRQAYLKAVADGVIDITLTHDIVGLAETPSALYKQGLSARVMKTASYIFHGAEKFNREVVFMSSFDLAYEQFKAKGYSEQAARQQAIETAKDLTYKSMFDYSTLNKPRFMQGSAQKVIFQFKQFSQQMTYLLSRSAFEAIYKDFSPQERQDIRYQIKSEDQLYRTGQPRMTDAELDAAVDKYIADYRKEARSRLLGVYGTTAVFAGASGLPLWWTVSATANALQAVFGEDDEDWDFDIWFKDWANDTFGGFFGDVVARGAASQVLGANVADRMSLNGLWFRDTRQSPDEVSWVQNQLINLLGPTAGVAINWAEAAKQYNQGYLDRAIETASPAAIKNGLKGLRFMSEGRATNLKGDEIVGDLTDVESFYQMMGFSPERLAQRQKANIEKKTIEQNILKRQARLKDAFFMAIDNDDDALMERTMDKLMEFNQKYPELALDGEDLSKSVRARYQRRILAESMGGMTYDRRLIGRLSELGGYAEDED
jgi:hypothetical protein